MKLSHSILQAAIAIGVITTANGFAPIQPIHQHHYSNKASLSTFSPSTSTSLYYDQDGNNNNTNETPVFTSPVLQQLYPDLLKYKEQYGHPNIPLGSKEGRQCNTLRRLHIQNKLTKDEIDWLDNLGFTFHSLEDVYKHADFDQLFHRLLAYEEAHPDSNFQIPKKCPEDPELGAWVTGIRRLGKDGVNPEHERRLTNVGFAWKSTRKCGSKFMNQYREYSQQIDQLGGNKETLFAKDPKVIGWVQAQQEALKRGTLSQTRIHYMELLFGDDWTTIGKSIV